MAFLGRPSKPVMGGFYMSNDLMAAARKQPSTIKRD